MSPFLRLPHVIPGASALPIDSSAVRPMFPIVLTEMVLDGPLKFIREQVVGSVIATLTNPIFGETLSIVPNDGRLQWSGNQLVRGPTLSSVGTATFTLVRTHPYAGNSPHKTEVTVEVTGLDFEYGVIIGASLEAAQHSTSGSASSNAALQTDARAHVLLANALVGAPLKFPQAFTRTDRDGRAFAMRGANMGYGSKTVRSIEQVVLKAVAKSKAGHVFISPGRNGIGGISLAEHQERYARACDALRRQGRILWHLGLWMREAYNPGDSNWNFLIALDAWLRAYAAANGDRYVPLSIPMHLQGAADPFTVDTTMIADGTHPNGKGGWSQAKYIAQDHFRPYFGEVWPDISAKLLDPTLNKITNPYMTGTAGKLANGATGVVPTGYWFQRNGAGYTCAAAIEIVEGPDGRNQVKITITPPGVAGAAETFMLRRDPNEFGAVGKVYEFAPALVQHNGSPALVLVRSRMQLTQSPEVTTTFFNKLTADEKNPTEAFSMRMSGNGIEYVSGSGGASTTVALDIVVDPAGTEPVVIHTTGWGFFESRLRETYPEDVLSIYNAG